MQSSLSEPHRMPPAPDFVRLRKESTVGKHEKENNPLPPPTPPPRKADNGSSLLKMLNFKAIKMDSDRTVIIALMLLLMGDSGDELLLLALLYIML